MRQATQSAAISKLFSKVLLLTSCPSGAIAACHIFCVLFVVVTSGFMSVVLCSESKIEIKDSHKTTSIAAVVWLACYPHSAAWLLRPRKAGHGFCSALHACQRTGAIAQALADDTKNKNTCQPLVFTTYLQTALLRRALFAPPRSDSHRLDRAASANRSVSLHYLQPLLLTPAQGCFTALL